MISYKDIALQILSYRSQADYKLLPSYSHFCPKFRWHGNGGRSGKNAIDSIRWPIPENHPMGAKILQKSPAQAELTHFVPNFVAMATGVGRGKVQLAAFDGPSSKTPL